MSNNGRNPIENEFKNSVSYKVANEAINGFADAAGRVGENIGRAAGEIGQNLGRAAVNVTRNIADSFDKSQSNNNVNYNNNNNNNNRNTYSGQPVNYQDDVRRSVQNNPYRVVKNQPVHQTPPPDRKQENNGESKGAARFFVAGALVALYAVSFPFSSLAHIFIAVGLGVGGYELGRMYTKWNSKRKSNKIAEEAKRKLEEMNRQEKEKEAAEKAKKEAEERAKTQVKSTGNPELDAIIAEGNDYILKFRAANDAIPGEQISADIDRIEKACKGIFEYIADNPKKINEIKKFMNYYLPTTLKLLDNYQRLQKQTVKGESISNSMFDIEGMMHTIASAFEKQLDTLFSSDELDIQAEIEVFKNILNQEGLAGDDNVPHLKL